MSYNRVAFLLFFYFLFLASYIFYAETVGDIKVNDTYIFYFLISIVSLGIVAGYYNLKNVGSRFFLFNAMLFFWSVAFYFNSFKILNLQRLWVDNSLAFIVYFLPILSFLPTALIKSRLKELNFLDLNAVKLYKMTCLLFSFSAIVLIGEMAITGIVPIASADMSQSRLEYSLPFVHVMGESFLRLSFYLSVYMIAVHKVRDRLLYLILVGVLLYFIVIFSRSGLMQLGLFSIIIFSFGKGVSFVRFGFKKTTFFIFLIMTFSILGSIRQGADFDINEYTYSKIDNKAVNWLYGYYFVNFDNLMLSMENDDVSYDYKRSFIFVSQILGTKPSQTDLNIYTYIGKLNLGTGFRDFYLDWGAYLGTLMLSFLVMFYTLLSLLIKTRLYILYQALLVTYIALFPMVNRLSGFIPFFVFTFVLLLDFVFRKNNKK